VDLPYELHIALRYLLAKRKQAFISVISSISTLGVTVGVMALVIALALMTGLQQELRDRILGSQPHVFVHKQGGIDDYRPEVARLSSLPHVVGAAPAILGKALITTPKDEAFITVKGIDPALEGRVTDIARSLERGDLASLGSAAGTAEVASPPGTPGTSAGRDGMPDRVDVPGILLGSDLASQLGVTVGDSVNVMTPQGTLSPMGLVPRTRRLRVAGVFRLGLFEFDSTYGFVSLDVARRLLDKDTIDWIQLRVDDIYAAPGVAQAIPATFGSSYVAQDWADMNRSLFSALSLEKMAISLTIGLIVMVAALNIVASLVLLVMEKHRDIAILKTMGASARSVTYIFMMQGLIIGVVGTAVGASLGWGLSWVFDHYRLIRIPMDVYQVSYVPFTVLPRDFAMVVVAAVVVCFVATIYPSRQAARLDPAQALRYE
jgi:lipoprotein-releasing system permease protein